MRVRRTDGGNPRPISERMQKTGVNMKHSAFFDSLQEYEEGRGREAMDNLLSWIDEAAKNLVANRNAANLRAYREAVKRFLEEAVSGSYRMKGRERWDRHGNRRALYLVEKVNRELEELASMVLQNQEDAVGIMAKMDEIRGMLIDLYY